MTFKIGKPIVRQRKPSGFYRFFQWDKSAREANIPSSLELLSLYLNTSRYLSSDIGAVPLGIKTNWSCQRVDDVIDGPPRSSWGP